MSYYYVGYIILYYTLHCIKYYIILWYIL